MKLVRHILLLMALMMLASAPSFAQVTFGSPPFGTVDSTSGPDVVDLANLNVHIQIPVLHKAGRGLDFTYDIGYDNSLWYPVTSGSTLVWTPDYNWGWRGITEAQLGYVSDTVTTTPWPYPYTDCYTTMYTNFAFHDGWATVGRCFGSSNFVPRAAPNAMLD
jgi:hypothetical protein